MMAQNKILSWHNQYNSIEVNRATLIYISWRSVPLSSFENGWGLEEGGDTELETSEVWSSGEGTRLGVESVQLKQITSSFSASSLPSVNGNNSVKCFEIFELKALHTCEVLSIANIWKEIGVKRMSSVSLLIHSVSSCKDSIKLCSLPAEYFQSILHSVISICWLWMTVTAVTVL